MTSEFGAPSQSVANTTVQGDLNQILIEHATMYPFQLAPFRSLYLDQVRQIAPERLEDRDDELTELAEFCLDPDQGPYTYWQAPAFAGKSALIAWFALHPPPGVRVVCFFVTARFKGEESRRAFVAEILGQLAKLLGERPPDEQRTDAREQHFHRMLGEAAERAATAEPSERLVLLIDGIDEDRAVTGDGDDYSIAALLPAAPPTGVRVIVSGRPEPPLPYDVPDSHPLRDPRIVRRLAQSPRAAAERVRMERELRQLLRGSRLEQAVVGFIAAAGGGLSAADLAELSRVPGYKVQELLATVAARSFTARESAWRPGVAPLVYVFAHEELQRAAAGLPGPGRLPKRRKRLHAWAADYQLRGWPEETPEYLLRGYFALLEETKDAARMLACAADWARQDRMIRLSGGPGGVLGEILTATRLLGQADEPDLPALARLAAHAAILTSHDKDKTPEMLPAAWADCGYWDRAAAAASALPDPDHRAGALAELTSAAASRGELGWARQLSVQAETAALDLDIYPQGQARILAELARTAADMGDLGRARTLVRLAAEAARAITEPDDRARTLTKLALAMVRWGDQEQREAIAGRAEAAAAAVTDPDDRATLLAELAIAVGTLGATEWADALFERAGAAANEITGRLFDHPGFSDAEEEDGTTTWRYSNRDVTLRELADVAVTAGRLVSAQKLALSISNPYSRTEQLAGLAVASAMARNRALADTVLGQAEAVADTVSDPKQQAQLLRVVTTAAVRAGDPARARALAARAEATALTIADTGERAAPLHMAVEAWIASGDFARTMLLIGSFRDPALRDSSFGTLCSSAIKAGDLDLAAQAALSMRRDLMRRVWNLAEVALAATRAGDRELAERLAEEAAATARTISDPEGQSAAFSSLAGALSDAGDLDRAEAAARAIVIPYRCALALGAAAEGVALAGHSVRALGLVAEADAVAELATVNDERAYALAGIARAAARCGDRELAERLAAAASAVPVSDNTAQSDLAQNLAFLAKSYAENGDLSSAEMAIRSIANPDDRARMLADLVEVAARSGDLGLAKLITPTIADPRQQARAMIDLAMALARAGDFDGAETIARSLAYPADVARLLADVAQVAAELSNADRAETIARSITEPDSKARALTWAAQGAAAADDRPRAEALLVQANAALQSAGGGTRYPVAIDLGEHAAELGLLADAARRAGDSERADALTQAHLMVTDRMDASARNETLASGRSMFPHRMFRHPSFTPSAETGFTDYSLPAGDPDTLAPTADSEDIEVGDRDDMGATLAASGLEQGDGAATPDPASEPGRDGPGDHEEPNHDVPDDGRAPTPADAVTASALEDLIDEAFEAVEAGDLGRALALVGHAETTAASVNSPEDRAWATAMLTTVYVLLGEGGRGRVLLGQFEAIAWSADGEQNADLVRTAHATAAAVLGDLDQAEALILSKPELDNPADLPFYRAFAFAALAGGLSELAAPAGDLQLTDSPMGAAVRHQAFLLRSNALTLLNRAHAAALSIDGPEERTDVLSAVTKSAAEVAEAAAMGGDQEQASALRGLAEAAALSVPDPAERAEILTGLAKAADKAGDTGRATTARAQALTAAEAITDWVGDRAAAFARIASGAPPAQARSLLARMLATFNWEASLDALAQVSPEAVTAIADEYLAAHAVLPPLAAP